MGSVRAADASSATAHPTSNSAATIRMNQGHGSIL
jgi:hypothetical protein